MALKIVSIGLKIAELVILVAATGVIGYFVKEYHDDLLKSDPKIDPYDEGYLGRYEFFLYATSVGAIIAIVSLVALFTGLHEKHGGAMVAVYALWTLQLLVASALLAKVLVTYNKELDIRQLKKSSCDLLDDEDKDYNCDQITGGVACGLLAAVLFLVDTFISFVATKQSSYQQ